MNFQENLFSWIPWSCILMQLRQPKSVVVKDQLSPPSNRDWALHIAAREKSKTNYILCFDANFMLTYHSSAIIN